MHRAKSVGIAGVRFGVSCDETRPYSAPEILPPRPAARARAR
jgi:hypothetical protein